MKIIDSTGLKCPMPLLFLRRGLVDINAGDKVCLISTDSKSINDVPKFCEQMGHSLLEIKPSEIQPQKQKSWQFIIAKKQ